MKLENVFFLIISGMILCGSLAVDKRIDRLENHVRLYKRTLETLRIDASVGKRLMERGKLRGPIADGDEPLGDCGSQLAQCKGCELVIEEAEHTMLNALTGKQHKFLLPQYWICPDE